MCLFCDVLLWGALGLPMCGVLHEPVHVAHEKRAVCTFDITIDAVRRSQCPVRIVQSADLTYEGLGESPRASEPTRERDAVVCREALEVGVGEGAHTQMVRVASFGL